MVSLSGSYVIAGIRDFIRYMAENVRLQAAKSLQKAEELSGIRESVNIQLYEDSIERSLRRSRDRVQSKKLESALDEVGHAGFLLDFAERFQVGAPFGNEMVVALASKAPLFGSELEDFTTERQFLTGLRARMVRLPAGETQAAVLRLRTVG